VRGEELAASFAPLYLGRAVSYLEGDGAGEHTTDRVRPDALERQLLERRIRLVEAWQPAGPGG
jgi:hypothetical protein